MKKRANGEGNGRYRDDLKLWETRITTGRNMETGGAIRKSIYGKTQAEVRKKITAAMHEVDEGIYTEPNRMSVAQWLDVWISEYLLGVKPRTLDLYTQQVRVHLKPSFGAVKLQALTAPMVQNMYNTAIRSGLSPKTVRNLHGIAHKAFSQAVKLGYIRYNPCDVCELPTIIKHEIKPIEGDMLTEFIRALKGNKYCNMLTVILFTGIRESEAIGLTWDCVDFAHGEITVCKQLQKRGKDYVFAPTKNSRIRRISPAPSVMDALKKQRSTQLEWKMTTGAQREWKENFVFTHEDGRHICANTLYHAYKKIVSELGMGEKRLHDLRHTFATLCIQNGDDIKTVSASLGHATVAFTLDIYGHVTQQMRQASSDRMEAFIQGAK